MHSDSHRSDRSSPASGDPHPHRDAGIGGEVDRWREEVHWLRGPALRLVRDADVADELVQETALIALRRGILTATMRPARSSDTHSSSGSPFGRAIDGVCSASRGPHSGQASGSDTDGTDPTDSDTDDGGGSSSGGGAGGSTGG